MLVGLARLGMAYLVRWQSHVCQADHEDAGFLVVKT